MHGFRDCHGRNWSIRVDVGAVKRVRSALGVDLMQVAERKTRDGGREPGVLERLASDPVLLVDVIYVLCRDQAQAAGVTDEEFGSAMAGDALEAAVNAMLGAIVDFSRTLAREPRSRGCWRRRLARPRRLGLGWRGSSRRRRRRRLAVRGRVFGHRRTEP